MKKKKVALVVGASSGIGEKVARRLATSECIVYGVARRTKRLERLKKAGVHIAYMDVTKTESIEAVIRHILDQHGYIDIVINNAGYGEYGILEEVSIKKAKQQFDVNLFGVARVNQCVLPVMRKQKSGRIIVVASSASHVATLGSGWYGASKHALKGLVEAQRMEVYPFNIQFVQIEPGPIKTEFETTAIETLNAQEAIEDYKELRYNYMWFLKHMFAKAPSAFSTVDKIVKASLIKKPKNIYRTTGSAKLLPILRGILGSHMYLKSVHHVILRRGRIK